MLFFGILFVIGGLITTAFGVLKNTILFNLFADLNARLERANLDTDFEISWIFSGPGTIVMIIGVLVIAIGIVLIVRSRKRKHRSRRRLR